MEIWEREKNNAFIKQVLHQDMIEQNEEKQKIRIQKEAYIRNLTELEDQIREKQGSKSAMNDQEIRINKSLLQDYSKLKSELY